MIEFIQDYVTKSLPPESFEDGERVERSPESELYFVRLGVAGYVVDDQLVDQDYQPIVRKTVLVVETTDRRFAATGRGGEVIGLDAPQRATSGPGNDVVFAGQPDSMTLTPTEVAQLRSDLAASVTLYEDHRTSTAAEIDQITHDLTTAQGDREAALAEAATLRSDLSAATDRLERSIAEATRLREAGETDAARIADLERQLAEATKPTAETTTAKPAAKAK